MPDTQIRYAIMESPVGKLLLAGSDAGLATIRFASADGIPHARPGWLHDADAHAAAVRQLHAYFAGKLFAFDVQLAPEGTPFQQDVWRLLREIPYGRTTSYGELAIKLGNPTASRAVGAANGKNPLPIIVPCHRVIGSAGALTGYAGGMERKRMLLAHEQAHAPNANVQLPLL